jgi:hypothetical protein
MEDNSKIVEEAPYHPGYESAGFDTFSNKIINEVNEYRKFKERHFNTAKNIVEHIKNGNV